MKQYVALIGGVSGTVGSALARELSSKKEWKVYGFARKVPETILEGVNYFQLDLNDRAKCIERLSELREITHVFYRGRATHEEQALESAKENLRLLDNLLNGIEPAALYAANASSAAEKPRTGSARYNNCLAKSSRAFRST